ncbi:MAG: hypothetical protein JW384_03145 [Nitrosomonadaceae bacterium]|nr:hypothetical protein [Nitrosomonadaceae bacterium]
MLEYANADSPIVGEKWVSLDSSERLELVSTAIAQNERFCFITPTQARENGQVFVTLEEPLSASERGLILRAAEAHLKVVVDSGVTLWCEPIGDKNSLRNLRGIQVLQ